MKELYDLPETADYLRRSVHSIYRDRRNLREPGTLGIRVGGKVLFRKSDLDEYLERLAEEQRAEIEWRRARIEEVAS